MALLELAFKVVQPAFRRNTKENVSAFAGLQHCTRWRLGHCNAHQRCGMSEIANLLGDSPKRFQCWCAWLGLFPDEVNSVVFWCARWKPTFFSSTTRTREFARIIVVDRDKRSWRGWFA